MSSAMVFKITVKNDGSKSLRVVQKDLEKLGKVSKATARDTKQAGFSMANAFKLNVAYKTLNLFTKAISTAGSEVLQFDKTLRTISAITETTATGIQSMSKQARLLAISTEHTASSIATMALGYNKMGFTVEQTNKMLAQSLNLVTTSGSDVDSVMRTVGSTMKAFGLQAEDTERIVNVIQSTVSGTAINFEDFSEAMKFVAPLANSTGQSLESMSGAIGILGDVGLKGTLGGTALKNMLIGLVKPSKEASKILGRFNLEGKSLAQIMRTLKEGTDLKEFSTIFNLRAVAPGLSIADKQEEVDSFIKKLEELDDKVTGSAEKVRKSLSSQFQIMGANISTALISVNEMYKAFGGEGKTVMETVNAQFQTFNTYLIENPKAMDDMFTVLGSVLELFKLLVNSVGGVVKLTHSIIGLDKALIALGVTVAVLKTKSLWLFSASAVTKFAKLSKTNLMLAKSYRLLGVSIKSLAGPVGIAVAAFLIIDRQLDKTIKKLDKGMELMGDFSREGKMTKVDLYTDMIQGLEAVAKHHEKTYNKMKARKDDIRSFETRTPADDRKLKELEHRYESASRVFNAKAKQEILKVMNNYGIAQATINSLMVQTKDGIIDLDESIKNIASARSKIIFKIDEDDGKTKGLGTGDNIDLGAGLKEKAKAPEIQSMITPFELLIKQQTDVFKSIENANGKLLPTLEDFNKATEAISKFSTQRGEIIQKASPEISSDEKFRITKELELMTKTLQGMQREQATGVAQEKLGAVFPQQSPNIFKNIGSSKETIANLNKTRDIMKGLLNGVKGTEEELAVLEQQFGTLYTSVQTNIKDMNFEQGMDNVVNATMTTLSALDTLAKASFDKVVARHEKKMGLLTKERDHAVRMAGDNKRRQAMILQDYAKKESDLQKKNEAERIEAAKKQKAIAITTAIINTALAATGVLAQTFGGPVTRAIAMAATLAMGAVQIGTIASQKYAFGTLGVQADGRGTSDLIPAYLSENEAVTSADRVQRVGGKEAFDQVLDEAESNITRKNNTGGLTFINPIGEEEYFTSLFTRFKEKELTWYS